MGRRVTIELSNEDFEKLLAKVKKEKCSIYAFVKSLILKAL